MKIHLPEAESAEKDVRAEVHSLARATGSETILLVEDEQSVRDLARTVLGRSGYAVLSACDGEKALSASQQRGGDIQLLITDAVMPEMRGRELAELMVKLRPQIKILLISGYTDDVAIHKGALAEGMQFLQKPFTPDALSRNVRLLLDEG